nr:hypothetical protein [Dechloromonas sp.]
MTTADFSTLDAAGLNLQAVFAIDQLPEKLRADIRHRFDPAGDYRQLILVGHGGTKMWEMAMRWVAAEEIVTDDPIDEFSIAQMHKFLSAYRHRIIYPAADSLGLQALGKLAGWHHDSPFMVGINAHWGSWYAYRALALADTDFPPTAPQEQPSPCLSCNGKPCLAACPSGAVMVEGFALDKCVAWRRQMQSPCSETCLSRLACPIAGEHRYSPEQIRHTYAISLRMIERYYG